MRQALASLEADGLIHKVQGRGSVVADHREVHRDVLSPGLTLQPGHQGVVRTRVTSYALVPRPDHLHSITGDRVLEFGRVRSVGDVVLSYIRTWLPAEVAEAITATDLEDSSLHQLLADRLGRQVAGGRNQIRAVAATARLAERLGVAEGSPLLLLEGRSVDRHGTTLEEFSTWHRGDQAAFDVEAAPPSARDDAPADRDRIERLTDTVQDVLAELGCAADTPRVSRMSSSHRVAPSGDQFEITGGGYRAVVTEGGAALRVLEHDGRPLCDGFAEDEMSSGGRGQLLMPWPNRIRDGAYSFDGRDLQLALTEPARAQRHPRAGPLGAWTLGGARRDSVSLGYRLMAQTGYPWTRRPARALRPVRRRADRDPDRDQPGDRPGAVRLRGPPLPRASGAGPVDGWELTLPAVTRLLADDRLIPVGEEPVDGTAYDFRVARPVRDTVPRRRVRRPDARRRRASRRPRCATPRPARASRCGSTEQHRWLHGLQRRRRRRRRAAAGRWPSSR